MGSSGEGLSGVWRNKRSRRIVCSVHAWDCYLQAGKLSFEKGEDATVAEKVNCNKEDQELCSRSRQGPREVSRSS